MRASGCRRLNSRLGASLATASKKAGASKDSRAQAQHSLLTACEAFLGY